ncbi:hypothetical protein ACTPEM_24025 [Clostridioides difficile]
MISIGIKPGKDIGYILNKMLEIVLSQLLLLLYA